MLLVEEQYDSVSTKYYKDDFMPNLLTNGCSITLGAELGEVTKTHKSGFEYQHCDTDYRHNNRWSTKLAMKLDMKPINLARGGGSNWRIWRTTQDYLLDNTANLAVIQMTEPSRFQIPISYDFVKKWKPTSAVTKLTDWAEGGIYGNEDCNTLEEYSHWNWGEQHQLQSFMNDRKSKPGKMTEFGRETDTGVELDENHYGDMADEITGYFLMNAQMHCYFDCLRHMLYLHNLFDSHNIPHLIVDMLEGFSICQFILDELEQVENIPLNVLVNKLKTNPYMFSYVIEPEPDDIKAVRVWFDYIKQSNMYTKFNNLFKAVATAKWFDGHPYRNYFSKITRNCPRVGDNDMYIGEMPRGHPDEVCHTIIAERMFSEIKRRNLL